MSPIQTVLAVYVVQQVFFALVWLTLARVGMAPRAAGLWGWGTLTMAAGVAAVVARSFLPDGIGAALPNLLNLFGMALVCRGLRVFVRAPLDDRQAVAITGTSLAVVLAAAVPTPNYVWIVVLTVTGMGLLIVMTLRHTWPRLRSEFGLRAALACSVPLWLVCLSFVARAAGALAGGGRPALERGSPAELAFALAFMVLAMALQFGMGAMVVLRLVKKLRHLSQHDGLTSLLNRRALELRLVAERARQRRDGTPLALLSLDIDHFKAVNDRHGHAAGDAVLRAVALLLADRARVTDVAARVGGEEFVLILPNTDAEGAWQLGERLLEAIRALRVEHEGQRLAVTASIGVALAAEGERSDALQRRLDRALYAAKHGGRDRIEPAEAPEPAGAPGAQRR